MKENERVRGQKGERMREVYGGGKKVRGVLEGLRVGVLKSFGEGL